MGQLVEFLINGLVESCVYLLVALGITVVFGLTRLINFAHGQYAVIGAFLTEDLISHGMSFWIALVVSLLAGGVLGLLTERLFLRFTTTRPLNGLIVSLGILLVLESAVQLYFGSQSKAVPSPVAGHYQVGSVIIPYDWLVVGGVSIVVAALALAGLRYTSLGRQMRAARADASAARHVGVSAGLMAAVAVTVASALAGLAGPLLGTLYPIGPYDGSTLVISGFAVALLGGLGSVPGAIVASLIYGIGSTLVAGYLNPSWVPYFTYGLIIVILLLRPTGLSRATAADDIYGNQGGVRLSRWQPVTAGEGLLAKALFVAFPFIVWVIASPGTQAYLVLAVLYAIQVYALSFVYTQTGILSLAGSGLMAVGAYAGALSAIHWGLNFWAAIPLAAALGAAANGLLGYLVSRCRGHYMVLVSLAFGVLIYQLTVSWSSLTRGDDGLYLSNGIPGIGQSAFSVFTLAVVLMLLSIGVVWWVSARTRLGLRLSSIRENEELARALGLRVGAYKVAAFAIAGVISAIGGLLFAYQQQFIGPDTFSTLVTIQLVMMLIFGGRTLSGPLVGAVLITLLPSVVGLGGVQTQLVVGALLALIVLLLPQGVVSSLGEAYRAARQTLLTRWGRAPAATIDTDMTAAPVLSTAPAAVGRGADAVEER